jgi:hypothetical protein
MCSQFLARSRRGEPLVEPAGIDCAIDRTGLCRTTEGRGVNRPAGAGKQYAEALKWTRGRPNAIYGSARPQQAPGQDKRRNGVGKIPGNLANTVRNLPQVGLASQDVASRPINIEGR